MKLDRRQFIVTAGAVAVATQIPAVSKPLYDAETMWECCYGPIAHTWPAMRTCIYENAERQGGSTARAGLRRRVEQAARERGVTIIDDPDEWERHAAIELEKWHWSRERA